jgi:TonB-dependent SusC/RagA subfamily outer membrane receptor
MVLPILVIAFGIVSIKVHATERITKKVNEIKAVVLQVITDTAKPTEKLKLKRIVDTSISHADPIVIKDDFKEALIIMDGKTVSWEQMKDISPNDIDAINVLKGDKATEYGMAGKNGVILIQTKFAPAQTISNIPTAPPPPNIETPPAPSGVLSIVGTKGAIVNNRGKALLYVINGVPVQKNTNIPVQNINPNDIESISILKDKSAMSLYGNEGVDGVVLIATKTGAKSGIITGYKMNAQEFVHKVPTVVNVAKHHLPLDSGGPEAKKIFGDKGKNGIIFISTKWLEKN